MTIQTRVPHKLKHPGPYLAIVKNHLDPGYTGGLEVALIKGQVDNTDAVAGQSLKVRYMTPFYGVTSSEHLRVDEPRDFGGTQKSYGMWMVPPDIGTTVMVIFINGEYNQGYWIGCVPEPFMNNMVPGIAAQTLPSTWLTSNENTEYGGATYLPVAEYNKKATASAGNVGNVPRPIHPFAKRLAQQGLLTDPIRGVTSSSARREIPSKVFGISTPGPLDPDGPRGGIKYGGRGTDVPISRLGGTTFVMDDGDAEGENELVRIRTRTGHQILMHNTKDLIYIANSQGTAWIELTANGKIDVYSQDSISLHTEQNFNFRAEFDVNIEAGRNVNIKGFSNVNIDAAGGDFTVFSKNSKLTSSKLYVSSTGNINIASQASIAIDALGNTLVAGTTLGLSGDSSINLTAGTIHNNNPGAPASAAGTVEVQDATLMTVYTDEATPSINTTLQRVPAHEPWSAHESVDPDKYNPLNLDTVPAAPGSTYTAPGPLPNAPAAPVDAVGALIPDGNYSKTTPELQAAISNAAVAYKTKTGRSVKLNSSYRSKAEQQALYDKWLAAGGGPNTPKAGGIYTPVNPNGSAWPNAHNRGIAVDTNQAAEMDKLGILAEFGLYRPIPTSDPVHVALRNPPPLVSKPTSNQPSPTKE